MRRLAGDLGFDPQSPPSELSFERWLAIFRFFIAEAGRTGRVRHVVEEVSHDGVLDTPVGAGITS